MAATSISVAMTTCNGEQFVGDQLSSILTQARPPEEVIVSDDRSTDRTMEIVERLATKTNVPVMVRQNPTRLGVTANFEAAIRQCRGDLVALADQDDVWLPGKLGVLLEAFEDPQRAVIVGDALVVDETGAPTGQRLWESFGMTACERRMILSGRTLPIQLRWNFATGATMCLRRELCDILLPFPERGLHDGWIAMISGSLGLLHGIASPLMKYRVHGANVAGIPPRSIRIRLHERTSDVAQHERELGFYGDVRDRLRLVNAPPAVIARVEEKLAHLETRAHLPKSPLRRALTVTQTARSGGYTRYSKRAVRSIAYDLIHG